MRWSGVGGWAGDQPPQTSDLDVSAPWVIHYRLSPGDHMTSIETKPQRAGDPAAGQAMAREARPRPRGPWRAVWALLGAAVLVVALAYVAFSARSTHQNANRPAGTPPNVSNALANLMRLDAIPPRTAPQFTLIDQNGRVVSLSSFEGRSVVLEFMDPHCTDICPIVSQEFVDAYHDLGRASSQVVFAAVNVNPYHTAVSDVAAFSRAHELSGIPSWHFFTGAVSELQPIWKNYGIYVDAPGPNTDVHHTSLVVFIDPQGKERYIAAPTDDHTSDGAAYLPPGQLTSWGRGIATLSRDLTGHP